MVEVASAGTIHECKSFAFCSRQNHASTTAFSFYRPDALPNTESTVSKHWRHLLQTGAKIRVISIHVWSQLEADIKFVTSYLTSVSPRKYTEFKTFISWAIEVAILKLCAHWISNTNLLLGYLDFYLDDTWVLFSCMPYESTTSYL